MRCTLPAMTHGWRVAPPQQDIFQSEDAIYLVMELVRGGDLFDRIIDRGR
jgi:serine/threonine protein kinase